MCVISPFEDVTLLWGSVSVCVRVRRRRILSCTDNQMFSQFGASYYDLLSALVPRTKLTHL